MRCGWSEPKEQRLAGGDFLDVVRREPTQHVRGVRGIIAAELHGRTLLVHRVVVVPGRPEEGVPRVPSRGGVAQLIPAELVQVLPDQGRVVTGSVEPCRDRGSGIVLEGARPAVRASVPPNPRGAWVPPRKHGCPTRTAQRFSDEGVGERYSLANQLRLDVRKIAAELVPTHVVYEDEHDVRLCRRRAKR